MILMEHIKICIHEYHCLCLTVGRSKLLKKTVKLQHPSVEVWPTGMHMDMKHLEYHYRAAPTV